MALIDMQRELLSLCFRAQPDGGEQRAFFIYRDMVRERMLRQIRVALPRTCALLGEDALAQAFVWHLEHEPPRTRYFRELVGAFVASALPLWAADVPGSTPCHPATADLARYELALWDLADVEAPEAVVGGDFSFDGIAVLCPVLRLLSLSHAVHGAQALEPRTTYLCLFRSTDAERVSTYVLTRATFELLTRLQQAECTVSQTVKDMATEARVTIDAAYLDALCETLAQLLELGVLLGSR